jgi:hypothetical protein
MSIPITKRVMTGGSKKGCGCPSGCNCGKTPAKMWGAAKVEHGKKSSPAKMGCYGKKK